MTLVEVMIAMIIITGGAMSAFMIARQNLRQALGTLYRAEAYRIAQRISEHAMTVPLSVFTPAGVGSSDPTGTPAQWIWSPTEASQTSLSLRGDSTDALIYPTTTTSVVFVKTLSSGPSPGRATALNITISWTYAGRNNSITIPLVRGI